MKSILKKAVAVSVLSTLMLSTAVFSGCGGSGNVTESTTAPPTEEVTTEMVTEPPTDPVPESANYIGNRTVDYDEANSRYRVFFSFSVYEDSEYIKQDANIKIRIEDDKGTELYNKVTAVTDEDYSEWTNNNWDGSRLMGVVYIPEKEIKKGASDTGKLYLSAYLENDENSWDEYAMNIYDLKIAQSTFKTPKLPYTVNEYDYKKNLKTTVSLESIAFEQSSYGSVDVTLKAKMTYNAKGANHSDYAHIGYKVKDEDGVVVGSGTFMVGPLAVGDVVQDKTYLSGDYEIGKKYTVELLDSD